MKDGLIQFIDSNGHRVSITFDSREIESFRFNNHRQVLHTGIRSELRCVGPWLRDFSIRWKPDAPLDILLEDTPEDTRFVELSFR